MIARRLKSPIEKAVFGIEGGVGLAALISAAWALGLSISGPDRHGFLLAFSFICGAFGVVSSTAALLFLRPGLMRLLSLASFTFGVLFLVVEMFSPYAGTFI